MPTYSYACTECDNRFDIVQSFSEDSLTVCPACSGKLRKLFNSVGIVFKGSGFYRTDSREAGKSSNGSSNGSSSASSTTSSDSGSSSGDSGTKSSDSAAKSSDSAKASTTTSAPKPATTAS